MSSLMHDSVRQKDSIKAPVNDTVGKAIVLEHERALATVIIQMKRTHISEVCRGVVW